MRIGSIVIDCLNFDKMLAFWQEALRYVPREPAKGGWIVPRDPEGRHPNISLNQVPERLMGRNWLHLDLYTSNRENEVKRLLKIGAKRHRQTYGPDDDFRVLEDPDGQPFLRDPKKQTMNSYVAAVSATCQKGKRLSLTMLLLCRLLSVACGASEFVCDATISMQLDSVI